MPWPLWRRCWSVSCSRSSPEMTTPRATRPPRRRRRPPVVGLAVAGVGVLAVLVLAAGHGRSDRSGAAGPVLLSPVATHLPATAPSPGPSDGPSVFPTSPPPPTTPPVFPFPPSVPPATPTGVPTSSPPFIGPTIPTPAPTVPVVPSGPVVVDPGDPTVPAPDPAATDDPGMSGVEKKPGRFDIPGQIRYAIDNWFRGLVIAAWNPILDLLGHTLLATPDVTRSGRVASIWSMNAGIANAVFVLFVVAGGAVVMSHDTLQTRHTLKEIAP